jgi:thiol:disulfide interchange protein DsbC
MKAFLFGVVSAAALLASLAQADEKSIKPLLEERLPGIKIERIQKAPWPGMYEVYADGRIIYTDEQALFAIKGSLVDLKNHRNLTAEHLNKYNAIPFSSLPLDLAIKVVKGNGKRKLAIFEDTDSPFSKQLEKELNKVDNVTVYVFLYPLEKLYPGSTVKSRKIWCAPDQAKAWQTAMKDGTVPEGKAKCAAPVEKLAAFGRAHKITGTPTLVFANGTRVPGAISAERLEKLLDESQAK